MAEFQDDRGKLLFKLVYYGPALSGKTTNLLRLHDSLQAPVRGNLVTLDTQGDRTLFFDMLPVGFRAPSGLLLKFKLFTVPGQVQHDATRKAVLSRADGVVFVADSQRTQGLNNAEAFQNLADNVARVGLDFETLPLVVQFNKRDLADVYSEQEIRARWRDHDWPLVFASALSGIGVRETFVALLRAVYRAVDATCELSTTHGLTEAHMISSVAHPEDVLGAGHPRCDTGPIRH